MKTLTFISSSAFREWLDRNHNKSDGLWLRIFKKSSGKAPVTYQDALGHALCYGWIDGQKKAYDEHSWLQKFTPRRVQSGWSKINTERAEQLINAGQMQQAGFEAVGAAKADGRWQKAYDSQRNTSVPEDFLKALAKSKKAKAFFDTLNKANVSDAGFSKQSLHDSRHSHYPEGKISNSRTRAAIAFFRFSPSSTIRRKSSSSLLRVPPETSLCLRDDASHSRGSRSLLFLLNGRAVCRDEAPICKNRCISKA